MVDYCWEHDESDPLHVAGNPVIGAQTLVGERIQLAEGAAAGAVLVSDATGCATWMPLADLYALLDDRYAAK